MAEPARNAESVKTVLIAGLANLTIAVAKAGAGLLSGSAAVLSEAAHSVADTSTEVLLFVSLRRGGRPADDEHPFGHGRESYIWAFVAAILTFVAGAGFSIYQGISSIRTERQTQDVLISYLVLAVSFVAESISLLRATRQVKGRAERLNIKPSRVIRRTPNTTIKAVFMEDSAALVGLVLAGAGLGLSELTGSPVWDGAASIGIGLLLLFVATTLGRSNLSLLIGQRAQEATRDQITEELLGAPGIQRIDSVLTLQLGPEEILVAAGVEFASEATSTELAAAASEARRRVMARNPAIRFVFLHPASAEPSR
jgi:cation diffusion facilitator family transporter